MSCIIGRRKTSAVAPTPRRTASWCATAAAAARASTAWQAAHVVVSPAAGVQRAPAPVVAPRRGRQGEIRSRVLRRECEFKVRPWVLRRERKVRSQFSRREREGKARSRVPQREREGEVEEEKAGRRWAEDGRPPEPASRSRRWSPSRRTPACRWWDGGVGEPGRMVLTDEADAADLASTAGSRPRRRVRGIGSAACARARPPLPSRPRRGSCWPALHGVAGRRSRRCRPGSDGPAGAAGLPHQAADVVVAAVVAGRGVRRRGDPRRPRRCEARAAGLMASNSTIKQAGSNSQVPQEQQEMGGEQGGCGADSREPELMELWLPRISARADVVVHDHRDSEIF